MGSSQSSHADKHGSKSAKHSTPEGVRGRKSIPQKGASVPHLRESVISLESRELSAIDATAAENLHEDDVHLYPTPEEAQDIDTASESEDETDEEESGDEGEW